MQYFCALYNQSCTFYSLPGECLQNLDLVISLNLDLFDYTQKKAENIAKLKILTEGWIKKIRQMISPEGN